MPLLRIQVIFINFYVGVTKISCRGFNATWTTKGDARSMFKEGLMDSEIDILEFHLGLRPRLFDY
jgi:hypothetical protein